jgi:two-component system, cell cycle sensor histidine kinase and response regulator CckA
MTRKLGDRPLKTLERAVQSLGEQVRALPEASRRELAATLQEVSRAIAALRAAEGSPPTEIPGGREGELPLGRCETILQHIFSAIPDLLTVIDRDFNIVMSNWYAQDHIPEAERCKPHKCYRVYHHRDRPCEPCHVREVFVTGRPQKTERINPLDGRTREFSAFPILNDAGEVILAVEDVRDITERHQAATAFMESEERFKLLFAYAPDAYILMDWQGNFLDVNLGTEALTGYGREELIGRNYQALPLFDERQNSMVAALFQQARNGNILGPVELSLNRKDGGHVIIEAKGLPLQRKGEGLMLGVARDITARKWAEEELFKNHVELQETAQRLEQSRNMLQLIIESIPVRVFWKDSDLRYLGCNTLFALDAGFKHPQQLLGQNDFAMGWREQADLYRSDDRQVMESRRPKMNIVEPQTTPAGARIWLKTSKVPLQMPNGEVFGVLGVYDDITTHKRAEEALRESEATLRTLIESNPESLFLLDTRGVILAASKVAAQRLDKSLDEIIGADAFALVPPEVGRKRFEIFQQVVATGRPRRFEDIRGDFHLDISMTPISDQDKVIQVAVLAVDITLRKQAEAALRESEARFRAVFEFAPVGISMTDLAGRLLQTNRYLQALLGYTAEELKGKEASKIIHPEDRSEGARLGMELLAGNHRYFSINTRLLRKDGAIIWGQVMVTLLRDARGEPEYFIGTVIDTTARNQAEAALRESEQRFRDITDYAAEWVWEVDATGKYRYSSPVVEQLLGYTAEEVRGKHFYDFFPPDQRGKLKDATLAAFAAKQPFRDFLTPNLHKNGQIVWLSSSGIPILDEPGNLLGYRGADIDITERREAEALSRNLIAGSPVGIYLIQNGKFQLVNQWFFTITGYGEEEFSNLEPLDLVHPEDREATRENAVQMLKGLTPVPYEYRTITKGGETKWIMETLSSIQYQGKRAVLGYFMDITQRKALEEQLLQAQKMEAVGRLAGGVAHDFNNLLMAITGYSELMRTKVLKDDPLYGHLENILKAGDRATALIQQLLTFSRRQIVHSQVIDLNRVVLDLEPMLRRLLGEDLDLAVVTDQRLGAVKADPGHLGQIVMNLVVNARDAMPGGGRLRVKTNAVEFQQTHSTRFGQVPPGAYVMLEVRDSGVGMDEATQAHAFEPFFTTKEPGKGTGLGLSTVYGIVNQSGGYLDLASEPGKGSAFTIYLPRLDAVVEPPKEKIPIAANYRGSETVLLVEDEDMLRGLLAKFLRLYGYTVLEARQAGEALLTCERHPGPIHLMVTDVVMPQMSGRELVDRLRPLRPEMKILYMSGYTEDALVQHGVADLSVPFLQKPFRPVELARRVHAVLHPPAGQERLLPADQKSSS